MIIKVKISLIFAALIIASGCSNSEINPSTNPVLEAPFDKLLIVPIEIKEKEYMFIVDTGASITVIDKEIANSVSKPIDLHRYPASYGKFEKIKTVNGSIINPTLVEPLTYKLGNKKIFDSDIWAAADLQLFSKALGYKVSGLLGVSDIRKFNWLVDNTKKRLKVLDQAPSVKNWQSCVGYEDRYNGSPTFELKNSEATLKLRLDTGANDSYVGIKFIDYAKGKYSFVTSLNKSTRKLGLAGINNTPMYELKNLSFAEKKLGPLKFSTSKNNNYGLGMNFLSEFDQYIVIPSLMLFCYNDYSARPARHPNLG